jgi:hypothetical protein
MGAMGSAYRILVGKPEGKRPLGRPRCRREDNIKVDLRGNKMTRYGVDASSSGKLLVAGCCEQGNEPSGSIKG